MSSSRNLHSLPARQSRNQIWRVALSGDTNEENPATVFGRNFMDESRFSLFFRFRCDVSRSTASLVFSKSREWKPTPFHPAPPRWYPLPIVTGGCSAGGGGTPTHQIRARPPRNNAPTTALHPTDRLHTSPPCAATRAKAPFPPPYFISAAARCRTGQLPLHPARQFLQTGPA